MYRERKEDLSVLKFMKAAFSDVPFVKVVDEFPNDKLVVPSIAVTTGPITYVLYELGSDDRFERRTWYFDVFTRDKNQRNEYAYRISERLRTSVVRVYDFDTDLVNPPPLDYCLSCVELQINFMPSFNNADVGFTHHATITATFEPTKV